MISRATAGFLLFALAFPALAQPPEIAGNPQDKARFDKRFRAADKDGDGALSRDEARRGMPSVYGRFDEIDADKDGNITQNELDGFIQRRYYWDLDRKIAPNVLIRGQF